MALQYVFEEVKIKSKIKRLKSHSLMGHVQHCILRTFCSRFYLLEVTKILHCLCSFDVGMGRSTAGRRLASSRLVRASSSTASCSPGRAYWRDSRLTTVLQIVTNWVFHTVYLHLVLKHRTFACFDLKCNLVACAVLYSQTVAKRFFDRFHLGLVCSESKILVLNI